MGGERRGRDGGRKYEWHKEGRFGSSNFLIVFTVLIGVYF